METGSFSPISDEYRDVAEIALAEIEARIVPDHQQEALPSRLVEAELLLELGDEFRRQPLRAAVLGAERRVGTAGLTAALLAGEIAAAAADPLGGGDVGPLQLRDDALHRTARRELHDQEADEHDPEDRRDHEQDAAEDVGGHRSALAVRSADLRGLVLVEPPGVEHAWIVLRYFLRPREHVPVGEPVGSPCSSGEPRSAWREVPDRGPARR